MRGYELRSHTADVAVEATGGTLGEAFGAAADGMAAAMCDAWPDDGDRYPIEVTAESREALLFDYLDELIYERDVRSVLPVDNTGRVERVEGGERPSELGSEPSKGNDPERSRPDDEQWRFEGEYRGVPLEKVGARDLKAVTYSEMAIEETAGGWRVYVVFDV